MAGEREDLRGKVLDLKDLAAYQDGAVASRTVVLKKAGTITAFAFDAGEGLPEHTAPFDAIVQCLEGQAEITIGGKPLHLAEGQMVIMPARVPHAVKALSRFRMLLTMIHE
ncbi:MAG: cupin domain-containing protein [Methanomicrobiales archaeon]|nr:cupin domain-containing protein [Methanomicrobiales archaeon]